MCVYAKLVHAPVVRARAHPPQERSAAAAAAAAHPSGPGVRVSTEHQPPAPADDAGTVAGGEKQ